MNDYKDLRVWQKSREQFKDVYFLTKEFPMEDRFGLVSQMRKSALSVPSNVAEGNGFKSIKKRHHFYEIAFGSACEIESQLVNCQDVGLLPLDKQEEFLDRADHVKRMVAGLVALEAKRLELP